MDLFIQYFLINLKDLGGQEHLAFQYHLLYHFNQGFLIYLKDLFIRYFPIILEDLMDQEHLLLLIDQFNLIILLDLMVQYPLVKFNEIYF